MTTESVATNALKNQHSHHSKTGEPLKNSDVPDLTFIPTLLPGEALASYVLRTKLMNVFSNSELISKRLFGTRSTKWSATFFGNLDHLGQVTNIDQHTLIRHTLLPIYQPFYPRQCYAQAQKILSTNWVGGLPRLLGDIHSRMQQPAICPKCISEDLTRYGFSYWRIYHQLTLVECCPQHQTLLLTHCPACEAPLVDLNNWILPNFGCPHCKQALPVTQISDSVESQAFLIRLAKFVEDAFLEQIPFVSERVRWAIYQNQAQKLKIHFRNNLWWKLSQLLIERYGSDRLERLDLSLTSGKTQGWIGLANLGIAYAADPTANLLMLSLLFKDTNDFVTATKEFDADMDIDDKPYLDKGVLYLKKEGGFNFDLLRSIVKSEKSSTEISHQYQIDVDLIKQLIKKHPKLQAARKRFRHRKQINQYRKKLADEVRQGSIKSIEDSKYINNKRYLWMLKHDHEWLIAFIENQPFNDNIIDIENLDEMDQQLAQTVSTICEAEFQKTRDPERITRYRFLEQFGYRTKLLIKNGRLPKTQQAIESHVEDFRSFTLRKLLTAISALMKEGRPISQETIRVMAKLSARSVKALNPLIEDMLKFLH